MLTSTLKTPTQNWNCILQETTGWWFEESREFDTDLQETYVNWQLYDAYGDPYGLPFEDFEDLTDFLIQNEQVRQALLEDFKTYNASLNPQN